MDFSDIRAYPDKFFQTYWYKILDDPHFKTLVNHLGSGQHLIKNKFIELKNLEQFKIVMIQLVDLIVQKTTKGITFSGVEELKTHKKQGSIFISNHRSTSLDPILFNYMLNKETGETAYNAAGDNLLNTSWLGHLIRLNRGFVVKRNVEDMDEKLLEANKLSLYIKSLIDKGKNVWIAQRNGRAKDGNDQTDSAVLAMLKLSHRDKSWDELSHEIPIIPISMSYEQIPLDTMIARDFLGMIDKSDNQRDSKQVFNEIGEQKRRIHIHVSPRIVGANRGDLVRSLDSNIIRGTRIWQSNTYAAELLKSIGLNKAKPVKWLKDKLMSQDLNIRNALLQLYAAPAINLKNLNNQIGD
ncbi:MAG: 1-acyl-sn-glycerol-3-phosphate acyltransferase [Spirochaetaceae bacterium]|jgi:1-acyl-sn-glycerol-3-phosphate acyltransferase|nr:1-acyl-sn-glycerol-3-phosphate acyltransferase [Spirochaetaceae bacterium]